MWLHGDNLAGLFNLRGMAAATPGSLVGDYLLASKGEVKATDRFAHGLLRVGPSDGARGTFVTAGDGTELHYETEGEGFPLVFTHGNLGFGQQF